MARQPVETEVAIVADTSTRPGPQASYVDWPAIFGGVVTAWAIVTVLSAFGSGIGLTMADSPWSEGASETWFFAAAALWFIWVQISSVMAGGYLAGRLRRRIDAVSEHEVEVRDGAHGVIVWGAATLIGAAIALGAASGVDSGLRGIGGNADSERGGGGDDIDRIVDRLLRPASVDRTATAGDGTRFRQGDGATTALRAEIERIVRTHAPSGTIPAAEKRYIVEVLETRRGIPGPEAQMRVNENLAAALAATRVKAEKARKAGILVSFLTAATLLVSALAGWWAAGRGGRHRDESLDLRHWFRIR